MFPENYSIKIVDESTGLPVKNIAVRVTIFAKYKNNYGFLPYISDEDGMIHFSKKMIEKEIDEKRSFYIMDYSGSLNNCYSKIEVSMMSSDRIKDLVKAMQTYDGIFNYPYDINTLQQVNNYKFEPESQIINFDNEESIFIIMKLKPRQEE